MTLSEKLDKLFRQSLEIDLSGKTKYTKAEVTLDEHGLPMYFNFSIQIENAHIGPSYKITNPENITNRTWNFITQSECYW